MLFSVVVPMYNIREYAERCINSILKQTFCDFELIIVDDGSVDGTRELVDELSNRDCRVRVIHKENGGLTSARKAGARAAKGEYIVPIDGDDWVEENLLQCYATQIQNHVPDVIIGGYKICGKNYEKRIQFCLESKVYTSESAEWKCFLENGLLSSCPNVWNKCFRREQYIPVQERIDDFINMGEDGCISYPILAYAKRIVVIDTCEYCYRVNEKSMTRSKAKKISMESALWRIEYFASCLPDTQGMREQIGGYACHSLLNVIRTNLENYSELVSSMDIELKRRSLNDYIMQKKVRGKQQDLIAHFIIKNKLFWIVKVLCEPWRA